MVLVFFRNEDSGKSEKAEKGTKVMRRLSSLRSRVTGSWQKDKVRERCTALLCARVLQLGFTNKLSSARCNGAVVLSFQGKNKEQSKEKEKETKEPKESWKEVHRHQLVPGVFSSGTSCSLCAKPLGNKSGLQCLSEYGCRCCSDPAWLSPAPHPPLGRTPIPRFSQPHGFHGLLHFSAWLHSPTLLLGLAWLFSSLNDH